METRENPVVRFNIWLRENFAVALLLFLVLNAAIALLGQKFISPPSPTAYGAHVTLSSLKGALPFNLKKGKSYTIRVSLTATDRSLDQASIVFDVGDSFNVSLFPLVPSAPSLITSGPLPFSYTNGSLPLGSTTQEIFKLTPTKRGASSFIVLIYGRVNGDGGVDLSSYAGSVLWTGIVS